MNWKVSRDLFYREIPESQLEEAGFFYDSSKEDNLWQLKLDEMSTPVKWLEGRRNCAVLCFPGAFSIFHQGHLEALKAARKRLLVQYRDVVAFISPDHDEYLNLKVGGGFGIDRRIRGIRELIKNEDWIRLDLWPAFFNNCAVNFTEVASRLQSYIDRHVGHKPVYYVAGADNARFALAFQKKGRCIIVGRPGSSIEKYSHLFNNERILYVELENEKSSSEIRKTLCPWEDWSPKVKLILRIENDKDLEIGEALEPFYDSVETAHINEQREAFKALPGKIISLDPLIPGDYNLGLSRNYDYMGMDLLGVIERPGVEKSISVLREIPSGEYNLFDDDVCTGTTMLVARSLISFAAGVYRKNIKINDEFAFTRGSDRVEVLDARDFRRGPLNGLVVNGERKPYTLPWVVPSVRCSVRNSFEFSNVMKVFLES